jgi:spore coat protein H
MELLSEFDRQGDQTIRLARAGPVLAAAAALCSACSGGPPLLGDPAARFELPPLQTSVPEYELIMDPQTLAKFYVDVQTPEQPATFVHDGHHQPVMVRLRGQGSRLWPKKSWHVKFPKGTHFDHRHVLNFLSEFREQSMMADKLGYDLLAAMHVPAPEASYALLKINGQFAGVFSEVEHVGGRFTKRHRFPDAEATIYRCPRNDCEMKTYRAPFQSNWIKKSNPGESDDVLHDMLDAINHTPEPDFAQMLEDRMELEIYLRDLASDALIEMNITEGSGSYMIYDRRLGHWVYVPWDLNNSDMRWQTWQSADAIPEVGHPVFNFTLTDPWVAREYQDNLKQDPGGQWTPVFSNLATRIAFHPELRERVLALIERGLDEVFRPDLLQPRFEAIQRMLAPYMAQDSYMQYDKWQQMPRYMRDYVTGRAAFLRSEIARWRSFKPGLVIEAFDPQQGWVELRNRGAAGVSTQGLVLTTNLRSALTRNVPAVSLGAGERVRFTAAQLGLTFAPQGELGLFDGQSVAGAIDVHFYGKLAAGRYEARSEGGDWEIR